MFWQLRKKKFKILVGVKVIGSGCFDKAVKNGTCFCSIIRLNDHEVLTPYGKGTDGLLSILCEHSDNMLVSVLSVHFVSERRIGYSSTPKEELKQVPAYLA